MINTYKDIDELAIEVHKLISNYTKAVKVVELIADCIRYDYNLCGTSQIERIINESGLVEPIKWNELENKHLTKDVRFINHIKSHLTADQHVVCKVCGKSVDDILGTDV